MAEKSGFFNARLINGDYDRKYSADDYCDNLSVIIANGVLRSTNDDLKVTMQGLTPKVNVGRAWINGHYYFNTTQMSLSPVAAPTGGARYDRVVLRLNLNLNERNISIVYVEGVASNNPTKPALTRNDNVYDLCLADIYIASGSSTAAVYDTRSDADVCGWVYSVSGDGSFFTSIDNQFYEWFDSVRDTLATTTILKRYQKRHFFSTGGTTSFNIGISQYDPDTCFVEIVVNGFLAMPNVDYTISGNTVTMSSALAGNTTVDVYVYKNIDGTGLNSIVDEVAELQDAVESLDGTSKFTYKLTGTDDNITLSQIAQAFLDGEYEAADVTEAAAAFLGRFSSSWWESLNDDAQITIRVEGQNLTATTPFEGSGTTASRFRWFGFGQIQSTDRKITIDFEECQNISIVPTSNTSNIVFYGTDIHVKNARVSLFTAEAGVNVDMVASSYATGDITFENCEFSVLTSGNVTLAQNGTFTNCRAYLRSSGGNCLCFVPKSAGFIRVIGGTFFTYIKASGMVASVFYIYGNETDAVAIATDISCPTKTLSGYSQAYLSTAYAGKVIIHGVCSTQTSQGSYNEIVGQVWKSKN